MSIPDDQVRLAITTDAIDPATLIAWAAEPSHGAANCFVGLVRDNHQGRQVLAITYDAFDPLALKVFGEIAAEVRQRWGDSLRIAISHFKGRQPVGGVSIVIVVGSPHRGESFEACRYVIDEIKRRAPIWKQEHFVDGDSGWVEGNPLPCAGAGRAAG